jgi:uracil-DNA glycosylase family 4
MTLSVRQQEYLQLLGIDVWVSRDTPATLADSCRGQDVTDTRTSGDEWTVLREQVAVCRKCQLHQGRTQTVFGTGNESAEWMIIGEAPGAEEDRQGEPFVGRAGKLLTSMLQSIGLDRKQVFIANILKCRPPNNRDPEPSEVAACEDYLRKQILLVRPKIILAVGRIAAQNLLKIDTPIGKMRGQRYEYTALNIPVIVTYHPAYLLRSPREKRKSWQDLQAAANLYRSLRK